MKGYLKYLSLISIVLFVIGLLYINSNRACIKSVKITDTQGTIRDIKIPFISKDKIEGVYEYDIELKNSKLFSGEIQIIPNDCVLKIMVNEDVISEFFYKRNSCDFKNGFYLNISKYLKKDVNRINIEIKNTVGNYGLGIRDTTRYEEYFILLIITCFFPLFIIKYYHKINFKHLWLSVRKYRKHILTALCVTGFLLFIIYSILLFNTQIEVTKSDGSKVLITLPNYNDQSEKDDVTYNIVCFYYSFFPVPININASDNIKSLIINGEDGSSLLTNNSIYSWNNKLEKTLEQFLKSGKNEISIKIDNQKSFSISNKNYNALVYFFFLMLFLSPLIYSVCNKFLYGKYIAPMFVFSILIWLMYAFYLPYNSFSYDISGHIQYIKYIYEESHIPLSGGGWSFYHPPLYYICAAFLWYMFNIFGVISESGLSEMLQIFSLLLFIIYSYFSVKTLSFIFSKHIKTLKDNIEQRLTAMLYIAIVGIFLFWPSNNIFSIRIGNDIMLYALYSVAFYYIVKWNFSKDYISLILSLIFTTLAVCTKTNAVLLFGIIGTLLIIHFIIDKKRKINIKGYLLKFALVSCFAVFSIYFAFNEKIKNFDGNLKMIVETTWKIQDIYKVEKHWSNFISFNPVQFVSNAYTSVVDNDKGRQSFLYYLFKTSLFGEFMFNKPGSIIFAKIISFLLLMLIAIIMSGFIISFYDFKTNAPFILGLLILLGSMIFYRISSPYSCSNDFRYIFPAVTTFAYFTGITGLFLVRKNKVLCLLLMLILVLFILSGLFFQFSFII